MRGATRNGKKQEEDKDKKGSIKRLFGVWRYLLPYKWLYLASLGLLFVSTLISTAFPYFIGNLVKSAEQSGTFMDLPLGDIMKILVVMIVIQSAFSFLRVWTSTIVSEKSMADVRRDLYAVLLSLPMGFHDSQRTGDLMSRITADVAQLRAALTTYIAEIIRQVLLFVGGLVWIFIFTPELALVMISTFPFLIIIVMVFGRVVRKISKKVQDNLADTNIIVEETLQSVNIVKAFTSERNELNRYRTSLGKVVRTAIKGSLYNAGMSSLIILCIFGGIVAVIWYGSVLVEQGTMSAGDIFFFVLQTVFIGGAVAGLGNLVGELMRAGGATERVLDIINMKGEFDLKQQKQLKEQRVKEKVVLNGDIAFEDLAFTYPTREDVTVLKDINLRIGNGEKVALVGASGAGKSTLVQLLLRFYDVSEGRITADGKPVNEYDLEAYRENFGIVPQEVILFGGTLKDNILYGKPDATDEEVREAARKANALDFIEKFPEGFNTEVGQRGIKLSGGQRQRIAIARAILKDPGILILDEATSSLDAESEGLVQDALETLMQNRTTIIIAHRLATIRNADRIYVLKEGQVVESGTHTELLSHEEGIYTNLIRLQLQEN